MPAFPGTTLATHLEVALAVASGSADVGLAVRSAAVALDLDFVPLAWEDFDLALPAAGLPIALPLVEHLRSPGVRGAIAKLSSCSTSQHRSGHGSRRLERAVVQPPPASMSFSRREE